MIVTTYMYRYIDAKSVLEKKLVKIMKEVFPNINDDHIKHVSSGSPLTSNFYYGTHHGEVMILNWKYKPCILIPRDTMVVIGIWLSSRLQSF